MYSRFFNLREEPFSMTPDPRFLFLSAQHEAAIESLLYGIRQRKGFMTLTGEVGTGKTTICRELINRLDKDIEIAVILNPLLSVFGLLKAINTDFGNKVRGKTVEEQLDGLHRFLISQAQKSHNAVVLIDEAQNLSVEALETVRLLSNLETDTQKLLQIILVGQPELENTLQSYRLRPLNQRISIRHHLGTLNLSETHNYIMHRLLCAGGDGQVSFENKAIRRLHLYSGGFPRLINILCDRSLLEAYARRVHTVNKSVVKEALRDVKLRPIEPWWRRLF
ncbi:MAG: ATPase [Deltaproteobacteria bacterium CG11_big_fil_rev_8_21_14_0_20_47_16]|nr:MAG: ATPase [Deltaproteobacteria bacterium CG11_big_fil_rev_8_21_14_0_20_47_16]